MGRKGVIISSIIVAGVVTFFVVTNSGAVPCEEVALTCTESDGAGKYDDVTFPAMSCPKAGFVFADGGFIGEAYVDCRAVKCVGKSCQKDKKKNTFPCARRPKNAAVNSCLRKRPTTGLGSGDGGYDFGDENVMQPGDWIGAGCEPCPCTQVAGIPWKK